MPYYIVVVVPILWNQCYWHNAAVVYIKPTIKCACVPSGLPHVPSMTTAMSWTSSCFESMLSMTQILLIKSRDLLSYTYRPRKTSVLPCLKISSRSPKSTRMATRAFINSTVTESHSETFFHVYLAVIPHSTL